MKISTYLLLAAMLLGCSLFAQQSSTLSPLTLDVPPEKMVSFEDYELVSFAINEVLEVLATGKPNTISFELQSRDQILPFTLNAIDLRGPDYQLLEAGTGKQGKRHDRRPTRQFRGRLETQLGGVAVFTLDDKYILGSWKDGDTMYHLEPLWQLWEEAPRDAYVIYTGDNVKEIPGFCGTEDVDGVNNKPSQAGNDKMDGCFEVDIALAADFEMFQRFGDAASVENFMLNTLANVQTNYDDEFDDELLFVVVATVIATSNATDPWTNSTDGSNGLLPNFRSWGNQGGFGVNFDVATLWTDRNLDGSSIGWAYVGGVCNGNRYNICQRFTNNAAALRVLLAHELGHNFG
ncbi:MAG: M12 family metallo-peptidase, partial [Bacteroidota bacterium]